MDALGPLAVVGGRVCTRLRDVTDDVGALDSTGFWVVAVSFEGAVVCARFDDVVAGSLPATTAWFPPSPATEWTTSLDHDRFCAGVETIRGAIAAGDVYQVNLCRVMSAPVARGSDVAALGAVLARRHPARYAAVVRLPEHGVEIASASPELFLSRDGDTVESRPIKGTAAAGQPFLAKDAAENVMIVDLVRNDLGRVCAFGSVSVPRLLEEEEHPGLRHLVSTVRGTLRPGAGWADLLDAAFPPGSVTGAPKVAALSMIERLEPVARGPYCGTVGWVDADRKLGELNVAIRTFWLADGRLHFGTGGGITWDSTPEGEWQETVLKASRLIEVATGAAVSG